MREGRSKEVKKQGWKEATQVEERCAIFEIRVMGLTPLKRQRCCRTPKKAPRVAPGLRDETLELGVEIIVGAEGRSSAAATAARPPTDRIAAAVRTCSSRKISWGSRLR